VGSREKSSLCQAKIEEIEDRLRTEIANISANILIDSLPNFVQPIVTKSWPVTAPGSQGVFGA
jgi:hypothetical protein